VLFLIEFASLPTMPQLQIRLQETCQEYSGMRYGLALQALVSWCLTRPSGPKPEVLRLKVQSFGPFLIGDDKMQYSMHGANICIKHRCSCNNSVLLWLYWPQKAPRGIA